MTKRYITWKRVRVNDSFYKDVNTNGAFEKATKDSKFYETPYQLKDGRFISYVEYPTETPEEIIDGLIEQYNEFEFNFITEEEANSLLSELGEDENGNNLVSVNAFVFIDDRPKDFI